MSKLGPNTTPGQYADAVQKFLRKKKIYFSLFMNAYPKFRQSSLKIAYDAEKRGFAIYGKKGLGKLKPIAMIPENEFVQQVKRNLPDFNDVYVNFPKAFQPAPEVYSSAGLKARSSEHVMQQANLNPIQGPHAFNPMSRPIPVPPRAEPPQQPPPPVPVRPSGANRPLPPIIEEPSSAANRPLPPIIEEPSPIYGASNLIKEPTQQEEYGSLELKTDDTYGELEVKPKRPPPVPPPRAPSPAQPTYGNLPKPRTPQVPPATPVYSQGSAGVRPTPLAPVFGQSQTPQRTSAVNAAGKIVTPVYGPTDAARTSGQADTPPQGPPPPVKPRRSFKQ